MIEFPQSSSESIQYRITQCNRYQVVKVCLPVQNSNKIQQQPQNSQAMPFASPILKHQLNCLYYGSQYKTKYGMMNLPDYQQTHEELAKMHVSIDCCSINERYFTKKLPLIIKGSHFETQATLLYNSYLHKRSKLYDLSPYTTYSPPRTSEQLLLSYPRVINPL